MKEPMAALPDTYRVPERFGLAAILALMTLMSVLFGMLRWLEAPAPVFIVLSLLVLVISLVQMRWGWVPREGSMAAGAAVLTLSVFVGALVEGGLMSLSWLIVASPCLAVGGALLGYLTGTVLAGIFLILDRLDARWRPVPDTEPVVAEVVEEDRGGAPPAAKNSE